ncbi:MAG: helix-turn-helix transcriptional regulator [Planctomycetes bacterium]|nr:helix-turn-helix transcriptional regulator [Planctomycetota bacterium]
MSKSRHRTVCSFAIRYSTSGTIPWHSHDCAQFVYATKGLITVETENGTWVVPSRSAIWVPSGRSHRIQTHGSVSLQSLYLDLDLKNNGIEDCTVVEVNGLLHELVLRICNTGVITGDSEETRNLIQFLEYQLHRLSPKPLAISLPNDDRARRVAIRILKSPGESVDLATMSRESGTSLRTIQRVFQKELGVSLSQWRFQVRIQRAAELLSQGHSVSQTALECGFETASSFISAFRSCFQETPGKYASR